MNASNSLTDELMGQLQGAPLQNMAQQLGMDSAQTEQAVSTALPVLLGALGGNNGDQPQGAMDMLGGAGRAWPVRCWSVRAWPAPWARR